VSLNKCKLCHILAVNSAGGQYPVCLFVFNFLCNNARRTTSSSNPIQGLPLTEKSVGHSRALQTVALQTVSIRRATNTLAEKGPKLHSDLVWVGNLDIRLCT